MQQSFWSGRFRPALCETVDKLPPVVSLRAGIGHLTIVDGDVVDVSNKNRQLPALDSTIGMPKAQVMAERLRSINPRLDLIVVQVN